MLINCKQIAIYTESITINGKQVAIYVDVNCSKLQITLSKLQYMLHELHENTEEGKTKYLETGKHEKLKI